ncbi:hypothetical protein [Bradyrhizobium sp. USDA 3364]
MMRTALALCVAVVWPGAILASPADLDEQPQMAIAMPAAIVPSPAGETLRGVVNSVDQRNDTLVIRLSAGTTEPFRVQDGLIFNAVRFGDPVEISVQTISGLRTIVGLSKE